MIHRFRAMCICRAMARRAARGVSGPAQWMYYCTLPQAAAAREAADDSGAPRADKGWYVCLCVCVCVKPWLGRTWGRQRWWWQRCLPLLPSSASSASYASIWHVWLPLPEANTLQGFGAPRRSAVASSTPESGVAERGLQATTHERRLRQCVFSSSHLRRVLPARSGTECPAAAEFPSRGAAYGPWRRALQSKIIPVLPGYEN